jgi:transcriptional regulator with GAF, ATPase, and Fis domain/iron only hydrogenase large subunit-like protein
VVNLGVVKTIEGLCSICFSCIRNCPVKAIKVEKGQANVIPDFCIYCGHCIEVCSKNAKCVRSSLDVLNEIMAFDGIKAACLAPSYVAEFTEVEAAQVVSALKKAGFDKVYEVAFGAQMVAEAYRDIITKQEDLKGYISSACPSIVFLIEKYFPNLIPKLVPIVSPMIALGRYLKKRYSHDKIKVVFIGPCSSKKAEYQDDEVKGCIDCVITFPELREFLDNKKVVLEEQNSENFDSPFVNAAKLFPLSGGLLKTAALQADILENRIITVEGRENCLTFLRNVSQGNIQFEFADILFCNGCISGPMFSKKQDYYTKMYQLKEHVRDNKNNYNYDDVLRAVDYSDIDFTRKFNDKSITLPHPTEKQIQEVLHSLGKYSKEDELNCGACGYDTCRNKAVAVIRGLAENEMCLPYLINKLEKSNLLLKSQLQDSSSGVGRFIGNSRPMQQVYQMIKKVARTDTTVLIMGESGTGKELAAQAIHELSLRANENYVSINCAALPENLLESELFGHVKGSFTGAVNDKKGLFEEAHKGTILLDEIGDISLSLQVKLLRVLQEGEFLRIGDTRPKKVDVRIIAATNKNLPQLVEEGTFRADLFYRLNVVAVTLPPLREKREDIPLLAITFLHRFNKKFNKSINRINNEAMEVLIQAEWKGNVRELENVIERAVILCEGSEITKDDFPPELFYQVQKGTKPILGENFSLKEHIEQYQMEIILKALEESDWVQAKAAKMLGLNRSTLHEMLKRYKKQLNSGL